MNIESIVLLMTAVSLAGGIAFGVWRITGAAHKLRADIERLQVDVAALRGEMAASYTIAAASEYALRLKLHNPSLCVPDPRKPGCLIGEEG